MARHSHGKDAGHRRPMSGKQKKRMMKERKKNHAEGIPISVIPQPTRGRVQTL